MLYRPRREWTLASFTPRRNSQHARAAGIRFVTQERPAFTVLVLAGPPGSGKTHLLHALAQHARGNPPSSTAWPACRPRNGRRKWSPGCTSAERTDFLRRMHLTPDAANRLSAFSMHSDAIRSNLPEAPQRVTDFVLASRERLLGLYGDWFHTLQIGTLL